jgi:hypothetical protein
VVDSTVNFGLHLCSDFWIEVACFDCIGKSPWLAILEEFVCLLLVSSILLPRKTFYTS